MIGVEIGTASTYTPADGPASNRRARRLRARQAEDALRDDVPLHLRRAGVDRRRARPEILVLPAPAVDRARRAAVDVGVRTLEVDAELLHALIDLAPQELQVRSLRPGLPGSH